MADIGSVSTHPMGGRVSGLCCDLVFGCLGVDHTLGVSDDGFSH